MFVKKWVIWVIWVIWRNYAIYKQKTGYEMGYLGYKMGYSHNYAIFEDKTMSKFKDILKARLATVTAEIKVADMADVAVPVAASVSNADTLKVEVIPVSAVAQVLPPSFDDIPTYTATPTQIDEWHNNLKRDIEIGLLRYFVKRNWGNLAQEFLKLVENSSVFEKYKIGFNRYGCIYTFALDKEHYIKAQTYCYEKENGGECCYYVKAGEKFLEKINQLILL